MAILRVKDRDGNITEILAIKGDKGEKGDKGDRGDTYTLTATDKQDIANIVMGMIESGDGVDY